MGGVGFGFPHFVRRSLNEIYAYDKLVEKVEKL